jgi:hypothetical protein
MKTPDYEGWISLDFLGFSRPNRDFSMGYARSSWRKSISISNFLQSIAVQAGFPQRLNPNAARSRCAGANAAKPKSGLAIDLTASLSRPPSYWNEYFATPR